MQACTDFMPWLVPFFPPKEFLKVNLEPQFLCALVSTGLGQSQRRAELADNSSSLLLHVCWVPGIAFALLHLV